jgi:lantibiotic transport system permease protein
MMLLRALAAEQLKTKRTLALLLAPVAPLAIIILNVAMTIDRSPAASGSKASNMWLDHGQNTLLLWLLLMYPLFITLETALLANLEHANRQWKHLCALPVERQAIYIAKFVSALAVLAISTAALYVYLIASGLFLRVVLPGRGFEGPVPWLTLLRPVVLAYVTSLLLISMHMWLAMRSPSFVMPIAVGIVAMVAAVILVQSDYNMWYPWTMPAVVVRFSLEGTAVRTSVLVGAVGGVVIAALGCWDASRRDVL